jgi:hypothetical protein
MRQGIVCQFLLPMRILRHASQGPLDVIEFRMGYMCRIVAIQQSKGRYQCSQLPFTRTRRIRVMVLDQAFAQARDGCDDDLGLEERFSEARCTAIASLQPNAFYVEDVPQDEEVCCRKGAVVELAENVLGDVDEVLGRSVAESSPDQRLFASAVAWHSPTTTTTGSGDGNGTSLISGIEATHNGQPRQRLCIHHEQQTECRGMCRTVNIVYDIGSIFSYKVGAR